MSDAASVREAMAGDLDAIYGVIAAAFERADEATLVAQLVADEAVLINLLAEQDDAIVGNVIVSPIRLEPTTSLTCGGVAPLSVTPELQGRGIGSQLMLAMIERCRAKDIDALFLLGHAAYYPRFGFRPSRLANEYGATDSFMDLALTAGCLDDLNGHAYYAKAFHETGV